MTWSASAKDLGAGFSAALAEPAATASRPKDSAKACFQPEILVMLGSPCKKERFVERPPPASARSSARCSGTPGRRTRRRCRPTGCRSSGGPSRRRRCRCPPPLGAWASRGGGGCRCEGGGGRSSSCRAPFKIEVRVSDAAVHGVRPALPADGREGGSKAALVADLLTGAVVPPTVDRVGHGVAGLVADEALLILRDRPARGLAAAAARVGLDRVYDGPGGAAVRAVVHAVSEARSAAGGARAARRVRGFR